MKYPMKSILASLPPEKRKSDGTITTFILRPLSWPASWFFLALGFTPNMVTALSGLCCLVALVFSFTPYMTLHIAAVVLFFVFGILDCTDGNMARTIGKKNIYGGWVDAAGGYFAYFALIASMAASTNLPGQGKLVVPFLNTDLAAISKIPGIWIWIAFLAVSANLMMRLYHQAFKNAELAAGIQQTPGKEKRFSEEIGITGYMPVLYAAGLFFKQLPWVLILYFAIYGLGFLATFYKIAKKIARR